MRLWRKILRWWHDRQWRKHRLRCVRVRVIEPEEMQEIEPGLRIGTPGRYEALVVCSCGQTHEMKIYGVRAKGRFFPIGFAAMADIEWGDNL